MSKAKLDQWWQRLSHAGDALKPNKFNTVTDYWTMVLLGPTRKVAKEALQSPQYETIYRDWLSRFAKAKPPAAFRLLFSVPEVTVPVWSDPKLVPIKFAHTTLSKVQLRQRRLRICRLEVKLFMRDRAALARYYRALVWSKVVFGGSLGPKAGKCQRMVDKTEKGFAAGKSNYWWFARNTVILLYATDRMDMLKGVKPRGLEPVFKKWRKWLYTHYDYLWNDPGQFRWTVRIVPVIRKLNPAMSLPARPFTDWKGPVPNASIFFGF